MPPSETSAAARRARSYLEVIRRVPPGRVVTYGQVATVAGHPRHAREVGAVLRKLPEGSAVPWQRVVNQSGRVSPRGPWGDEEYQRRLLEVEGVCFDERGRIDLDQIRWEPTEAIPRGRSRGGARRSKRVPKR